jgi:hypothetical protein
MTNVEIYNKMKKWKITEPLIKQFVNGLFKPYELRILITHAVKRLKELESP